MQALQRIIAAITAAFVAAVGFLPRRHWQAAVRPHWIEVALTFFLATVGIGQICVYLRQASIMDAQTGISERQLKIQSAEQRPWLSIEGATLNDSYERLNGITTTGVLAVKNFGHSLAINVLPRTAVVPVSFSSRKTEEDKVCETYDFLNEGGTTIFDKQDLPIRFQMSEVDLQKFIETNKGATSIWMTLLVCVQYRSLFDKDQHHAGYAYDLAPIEIHDVPIGGKIPLPQPAGHQNPFTPTRID
jgi:hypothetical protein